MHYLALDTAHAADARSASSSGRCQRAADLRARQAASSTSRVARIAGLLAALAPAMLHFGATSADAVYLTLGLLAAIAAARASRWLGALALAVVDAVRLVAARGRAPGRRSSSSPATASRPRCKLGVIIGAVAARLPGAVRARHRLRPDRHAAGHAARSTSSGSPSRRPYAYWLFGSPTAFLLILGVPIAWLALTAPRAGTPEALAIFAVLADRDVARLHQGRDRAHLALPRAARVPRAPRRSSAARQLLVALLAVQAVVYELLFDTLW